MPIKKTQEQFEKEIYAKFNGEYTVIGRYINSHTQIEMKHNICGNVWNTTAPYDLLKKKPNTCPKCASNQSWRSTLDLLQVKINELYNSEFILSGEYINNKTKVKVTHIICGNEHRYRPDLLCQGKYRCPTCSKHEPSAVSKHVEDVLKDLDIQYEKERTFEWLKYEMSLYLDYFLPEYSIAIEADGEQHYIPKRGGNDEFIKTMIRDKTKVSLCKENGITVLRVPSWLAPHQLKPFLTKLLFENNVLDF